MSQYKETDEKGDFDLPNFDVDQPEPAPAPPAPLPRPVAADVCPEDWTRLQVRVLPVAAKCLTALFVARPAVSDVLFNRLVRVFQLVRDIAWSAAVHFGVPPEHLAKMRSSDLGKASEWKLTQLAPLYGELRKLPGDKASLVTTDLPAPKGSARFLFNCRVHLIRALYGHAGRQQPEFLEDVERFWEQAGRKPQQFGDYVLEQATALRRRGKGTREVTKSDLATEAFPSILRDLANAYRHQASESETAQTLFLNREFPEQTFEEVCWTSLQDAVTEWLRASRLDSLKVAEAGRPEKGGWVMKEVDTDPLRFLHALAGEIEVQQGKRFVIGESGGRYTVLFPYLREFRD